MKRALLVGFGVLVVLVPARGQDTPQQAAVGYLRALQNPDGGFRPAASPGPSSVRATSSGLRALKYFGGTPRDRKACADFVRRCFDADRGGFADVPGGRPDVFTTAVGLMAAVEAQLPTGPYADRVVKFLGEHARTFEEIRIAAAGLEALGKSPPQRTDWLAELRKLRNEDGTYGRGDGQARDTGGAVVAVLRLGGKVEDPRAVIRALDAAQRSDGAFGQAGADASDLETTYRVLRAYVMLEARPARVRDCREFVARCRNRDGGYGVAPGQPSTVAGTYYASIILHWLGPK